MRVRLTRKLADLMDGVDLRRCEVGDVLELPPSEARLLIAEQWAVQDTGTERPRALHLDEDLENAS